MVDTSWIAKQFAEDEKRHVESLDKMRAEERRAVKWLAAAREYYANLRNDLNVLADAFTKRIPEHIPMKRVSVHEESIEVTSYKYAHVAVTVTLNVPLERIDCVYKSNIVDPVTVTYKLRDLPDGSGMALQVDRDGYITSGEEARTIIEPLFAEARRYINSC